MDHFSIKTDPFAFIKPGLRREIIETVASMNGGRDLPGRSAPRRNSFFSLFLP
jgi:hypothetical protein